MMGTPMSSKNCSTGRLVAAPPAAMYLEEQRIVGRNTISESVK
jgi:hypothetical protein